MDIDLDEKMKPEEIKQVEIPEVDIMAQIESNAEEGGLVLNL